MPASIRTDAGPRLTLHQLRIVWAVANAGTVSRAAKQLALSQPSLSQQISKLEDAIGNKVFDRRSGRMVLTDVGHFLVERAEQVMRDVQALEDGLGGFAGGARSVSIAGIASPMRVLLPQALQLFRQVAPEITLDIHEASPGDVLAMLYARHANIGIVAASTIAQAGMGFVQVPLLDDPYVLVTPQSLDLGSVGSPADLDTASRSTLNSAIQFVYGTPHQKRVEAWFAMTLPNATTIARCRSFEIAVAMVRAGLGVSLAPALSCFAGDTLLPGISIYNVGLDIPRDLVALVPSQYRHLAPFSQLLVALQQTAAARPRPPIEAMPPALRPFAT